MAALKAFRVTVYIIVSLCAWTFSASAEDVNVESSNVKRAIEAAIFGNDTSSDQTSEDELERRSDDEVALKVNPNRPVDQSASANDLDSEPQETDWSISLDYENHIFPSYLIATATLKEDEEEELSGEEDSEPKYQVGESAGVLNVFIKSPQNRSKVLIEVLPNQLIQPSTYRVTLDKKGPEYLVVPKVNWDYTALHKVRQQIPINIQVKLSINGVDHGTKSVTATVNSINDLMWVYTASEEEVYDYTWLGAAFVNENHPLVQKLLKEALGLGIVDSFDDYQQGEIEKVYLQVFAIWKVLQKRGLKYSNALTTATESDSILLQHVRFLDESIDNQQANCVDGSVLFAAALRKIGLRPYLVSTPVHMFVAFDLDPSGQNTVGLETTMLGQREAEGYKPLTGVSKAFSDRMAKDAVWKTFAAAIHSGNAQLEEHAAEFADSENIDYQIVDIAKARKLGVNPIAYLP